ncbi:MAG: hypothetical protein ACFFG0_04125 [Candidatus Thorarchaeota archaeon]
MLNITFLYYLKPIKYHPYTSDTRDEVFKMDITDETEEFRRELIKYFNENGIRCYDDNKIVFELERNGKKIFYGFYDNKLSIGLSYYNEHEKPL